MVKSLFSEYVQKFFGLIVGKIAETINGKKIEEMLLHKTMLTEEYSADLGWGSTDINTSIVAADVVSMDSSLPLKKRDAIESASGTIPKIGIKFRKGEKYISDINVMKAKGANEAQVAARVFEDTPRCIKGMDVRKEIMFLQGLSTGQVLVERFDENGNNVGTGIRAKYGYKDENKLSAKVAWGEVGYSPQDDVQSAFDKAQEDGNGISLVMMSKKFFNLFRNSEQGKRLYANYKGAIITENSIISVPSRSEFISAFEDEFGAKLTVVDSSFKVEKERGERVSVKPWEEANIVFLPSEKVGRLVYGTLAEETNPVSGVAYQKAGSHVLVSKYSKNEPLEEFTSAQALCLPVIDGVGEVYLLNAGAKEVEQG